MIALDVMADLSVAEMHSNNVDLAWTYPFHPMPWSVVISTHTSALVGRKSEDFKVAYLIWNDVKHDKAKVKSR